MAVMIREEHRLCISRCHTALGNKCRCICSGKFHGPKNYAQELEANKDFVKGLLAAAKEAMQGEPEGG